MTTFCLDFGNTRKKSVVYENETIIYSQVFTQNIIAEVEAIIQQYQPQSSILSSVVLDNLGVDDILKTKTHFHQLNFTSKLPITTPVGKPETIGSDRLAICSGAVAMFNNYHILAIGLGSCITYNFINNQCEFLGGSISPGMNMRFKAMNDYTALLPIIKAEHQFPLVGYDTKTNLLSGVLLGLAKEIDGIVEMYKTKYENLKVVLTGGDADFFIQHLQQNIAYNKNLLFDGLLQISKLNSH